MPIQSWRRRSAIRARHVLRAEVTDVELEHALREVSYPARRWQLVACAEGSGCGNNVLTLLLRLPDRDYPDLAAISLAAARPGVVESPPGEVVVSR